MKRPAATLSETSNGASARTIEPPSGRRGAIVNALQHLIQEKGYAEITLTYLAKRSGMSVSHFLYYFPSKEAVLEELCQGLLKNFLSYVDSHRSNTPLERIEHLVRIIFSKQTFARSEFGFMIEILALSRHYPRVSKHFDEYTEGMNDYLIDLYRRVPRTPGVSAEDAATVAAAIWGGLLYNALFDKSLKDERARYLFREMLYRLAGLDPDKPAKSVRPASHRKTGRKSSKPQLLREL
jgi:AcrR family transcriptional regulator